jgi:hypothetical protein
MNLFKNKISGDAKTQVSDKVAAVLANSIIKFQQRLSGCLNQWFNACSIRRKKSILIAFALLTSIMLITGVFCTFYKIPKLSQNYTSAHIGMPSDLPKPQFSKRQLIDSLTKKK